MMGEILANSSQLSFATDFSVTKISLGYNNKFYIKKKKKSKCNKELWLTASANLFDRWCSLCTNIHYSS